MSSTMLSGIMSILLSVVSQIVAIMMAPIGAIINATLPEVDYVFTQVSTWVDYLTEYAGWVINAFAIPSLVITMIITYYGFIVTTSFGAYGIKLAIKWYEAIKP